MLIYDNIFNGKQNIANIILTVIVQLAILYRFKSAVFRQTSSNHESLSEHKGG